MNTFVKIFGWTVAITLLATINGLIGPIIGWWGLLILIPVAAFAGLGISMLDDLTKKEEK